MSLDVGQIEGTLKLDVSPYEQPFDRMVDKTRRGSAQLSAELLDAARSASASLARIDAQSTATAQSMASLAAESAQASSAARAASASLDRVERSAANTAVGVGQLDRRLLDVDARLGRVANSAHVAATASVEGFTDLRILLSAVDENMQLLTQHTLQQAAATSRIVPKADPARPSTRGGAANGALAIAGAIGAVNPRVGQLVSGVTAVKAVSDELGYSFGKSAAVVGAAVVPIAAATAALGFLKEGIDRAADMEQTRISFETIIGDADLAHRTLADLKRFADTTPLEFPEIASAGKQLLAMGVPAKDLVATLRRLGDVSSGLGQPLGEMAYLLGQVKSQGRAMTQDLNQFAGRGVPIYAELAKVLKTSEAGVREFAEAGKIGYREIEAAIVSMTDAGGKFHDMTLRQSKSLKGELSTLADAWGSVERAAGEAFLAGGDANGGIEDLTDRVNKLEPAAERFGAALRHAFESALPLAEKALDLAGYLADRFTGTDGKGTVSGSSNAPVARGVEQTTDPKALLTAAASLSAARKTMASSIRKVDSFWDGVNQGGLVFGTNDVSSEVKKQLDASYERAGSTGSVDALDAIVEKLTAKQAAGTPLTPAEVASLQQAIAAIGREVDEFRTTLAATRTDLKGTQKSFEQSPIAAKAATNRIRASELDPHVAIAQGGLDESRAALAAAADALAAGRRASQPKASQPATVATAATPVTTGKSALPGVVDPNATPKERRAAAAAAAREQKAQARSAANTVDASTDARVAELRAAGDKLDADLAHVAASHADDLRGAKTPEETLAINKQIAAEQDAVRRKYADAAAKAQAEQAKRDRAAAATAKRAADAEAKRQVTDARRVADAIGDYQLEAQVTILRAYGREFDAAMLEAEHRYAERVRKAETEEERLTAKVALETTKRQLVKGRREEIAKRTGVSLPTTPIANATQRQRTATNAAQRALAQLDLREAKGNKLTPAEEARRARLRKQTGTGADGLPSDADPSSEAAARDRLKRAKTPAERALAVLEVREAKGEKLSPADVARRDRLRDQLGIDPADRRSPSAAAAAATSAAAGAPAAPAAPVATALTPAEVNARRIAEQNALATRMKPVFDAAATPVQQAQAGRAYDEASAAIDRRYQGTGAAAAAAAAKATPRASPGSGAAQAAGRVAGIDAARGGATTRPSGVGGSTTVELKPVDSHEVAVAIGDYLKPWVASQLRAMQAGAKNAAQAARVGRAL